MPKIVLVDGSSYLFRAFHALPYLTNSTGEPTGAIIGVINMLKKLNNQFKTDYVTVIFDAKGKSFRNDIYPEYKANRKKMDDDLRVQIEPLHQIIKNMGYPLIIEEGVEADDVIGTLAKKLSAQGCAVVIASGDKDMAQLVTDKIVMYDSMKNETTDIAMVNEKFGVSPDQIIDYLALMGDSSDNIPGVPNVGPKTAVKWLQEFKNIEGVIANKDVIKGKVGENLRNNIDLLRLSYTLATIKCDVDVSDDLETLKCVEPNNRYLFEVFTHYEFNSLLNNLKADDKPKIELVKKDIKKDYKIILDKGEFVKFVTKLSATELFAFDTETDSLNTQEANLIGVSFSFAEGEAYYIPLQHRYLGAPLQLDLEFVLTALKPIFARNDNIKIAHNFKFDEKVLSKYGVEICGEINDTMIMAYVLKSTGRHSMDSLSKEHLGIEPIPFTQIVGTGKKQKTIDEIEVEIAGEYAAEDADVTFRLYNALFAQISKDETLYKLYTEMEMPLTLILNDMEKLGVKIDSDKLHNQSFEIAEKISELESKCFEVCGEEFNLSSPAQLKTVLFDKMGIPPTKKTKGGQASTSEEVLQQLAEEYEIAGLIMQYRHLSKLKNTYIDKLPKLTDANGRVHTSYNQAGTITGRLSSSEPNLQNIPIKTAQGRKIREAFIAEEGYSIVAADYSQVELRIMAHLSKDKNLIKAFNNNLDIHTATAAETLGLNIEDVTSEQRRQAKAVNFGLIYGMSAFGLAKQLNIGRNEAQDYIDTYFARYPAVKEYMQQAKEFAKKHGYVETVFGRRLYLPEITAKNAIARNGAERAAVNAPMQGTAADIIKKAMINVKNELINKYNQDIKMIMQVHDELVFEVKQENITEIVSRIKEIMEGAVSLSVPLDVNVDIGDNWDQAH